MAEVLAALQAALEAAGVTVRERHYRLWLRWATGSEEWRRDIWEVQVVGAEVTVYQWFRGHLWGTYRFDLAVTDPVAALLRLCRPNDQ